MAPLNRGRMPRQSPLRSTMSAARKRNMVAQVCDAAKKKSMLANKVPDELLLMIIPFLGYEVGALSALSLTCKNLRRVMLPEACKANAKGNCAALHWACVNGHTDIARIMLDAGASPEMQFSPVVCWSAITDPFTVLPGDDAETQKRKARGRKAVTAGVGTPGHWPAREMVTPLAIATAWRHVEVVRLLVDRGMDVTRDSYFSAAHVSFGLSLKMCPFVQSEDRPAELRTMNEILEILLSPRAIAQHDGRQVRHRTLVNDVIQTVRNPTLNVETLRILLDADSATMIRGGATTVYGDKVCAITPIRIIMGYRNTFFDEVIDNSWEKLDMLMGRGHATAMADAGIPILHHFLRLEASSARLTKLVKALLAHGADPNALDKFGRSALVVCCSTWQQYSNACDGHYPQTLAADIMRSLLDAGAHPDGPRPFNDKWNYHITTPLHMICLSSKGRTELAELLLDHGADVNVRDTHGEPALHSAIRKKDINIVRLLLDRGADVSLSNTFGTTALHQLLLHAVTPLHQLVPHAEAQDAQLMDSAYSPQTDLVLAEALISHRHSVQSQDKMGRSPIDLSRLFGLGDLEMMLSSAAGSQ